MVAQSDDHPGHVMPMPWSVRCAMEDFEGDIDEGDIIMLNDAYRGGTHLNDVTVLFPVFAGGELFIFPAVRAHWADVGGMTPGSYSGLSTSIYQEGVRIPPVKLYERGRRNEGVMRLLLSNMRLPEERLGDLNASLGAWSGGGGAHRTPRCEVRPGHRAWLHRDEPRPLRAADARSHPRAARWRVRVRGLSRVL